MPSRSKGLLSSSSSSWLMACDPWDDAMLVVQSQLCCATRGGAGGQTREKEEGGISTLACRQEGRGRREEMSFGWNGVERRKEGKRKETSTGFYCDAGLRKAKREDSHDVGGQPSQYAHATLSLCSRLGVLFSAEQRGAEGGVKAILGINNGQDTGCDVRKKRCSLSRTKKKGASRTMIN